jgi:hypothetical protein
VQTGPATPEAIGADPSAHEEVRMSVLDDLLPHVSTEVLAAMLARPPDDRPFENLFFEFKSQVVHVDKSVAAFANAEGGAIFYGATSDNARLTGFPGLPELPRGEEWPLIVNNLVLGHISPLPAWEPIVVPSPTTGSPVVVVRVPRSTRGPHVLCKNGAIYLRSPGGSSDPISDRATLDVLIARGRTAGARVAERIADFHTVPESPVAPGEWCFSAVAVPLPYGGAPQSWLLTRSGCESAPHLFMPSSYLPDCKGTELLEDGVALDFGSCRMAIFTDGTVHIWWETPRNDKTIPVPALMGTLIELFVVQSRKFDPPVHEIALDVWLQAADVTLREGSFDYPSGRRAMAPRRWRARDEGSTIGKAVVKPVGRLTRRLWRTAGAGVYEPE